MFWPASLPLRITSLAAILMLLVTGVGVGAAAVRISHDADQNDHLQSGYLADRDAPDRASRDAARTPSPSTGISPSASTTAGGTASQTPSPARTTSSRPGTSATAKPKSTSSAATVVSSGTCEASFYDEPQLTANGETFNTYALTAAHKSLAFNTRVRVTNLANGKSVTVRINDRGPYVSGRCLDLSLVAFQAIASISAGVAQVRYEVLGT